MSFRDALVGEQVSGVMAVRQGGENYFEGTLRNGAAWGKARGVGTTLDSAGAAHRWSTRGEWSVRLDR